MYTQQFVCKREKNTDLFYIKALLWVCYGSVTRARPRQGQTQAAGRQSDQRGGMGVGGAPFCFHRCLYNKNNSLPREWVSLLSLKNSFGILWLAPVPGPGRPGPPSRLRTEVRAPRACAGLRCSECLTWRKNGVSLGARERPGSRSPDVRSGLGPPAPRLQQTPPPRTLPGAKPRGRKPRSAAAGAVGCGLRELRAGPAGPGREGAAATSAVGSGVKSSGDSPVAAAGARTSAHVPTWVWTRFARSGQPLASDRPTL